MKLFAVSSSKLSKSQQWVQATHAVAQYLLDHPGTPWRNQTLVMLKTSNVYQLSKYLESQGVVFSTFLEPHYNNKLTALAAVDIDMYVESLGLI